MTDQEFELDQEYLYEMRYELQQLIRQHLVDKSRDYGEKFFFAVYSAAKGAWDDVKKDLRRNRITLEDANMIVDMFLAVKIINEPQARTYKTQFYVIAEEKYLTEIEREKQCTTQNIAVQSVAN